jgi:hypothetical protein
MAAPAPLLAAVRTLTAAAGVHAPSAAAAAVAAAAVVAVGVDGDEEAEIMNTIKLSRHLRALALAGASAFLVLPALAAGGKAFPTPEAAMEAFGAAVIDNDEAAKAALLGPDFREAIPPQGDEVRYTFIEAWVRSHRIEPDGERKAKIAVGDKGWTLPIPLLKTAAGWQFDMKAGAREMQIRRIGRNELSVIKVMLAYAEAQREYQLEDRNGDGVREYAQRIGSTSGKKDGLYWPTGSGELPSPLGPLLAAAAADGKGPVQGIFHGYRFRILTAQGADAPGGARSYLDNGHLTGGFAMIAWPARWGETGIMSFIVNQDGQVFEADLGPDSARAAARIREYNPKDPWQRTAAR